MLAFWRACCAHLLVEGCPGRPCRLLAEFGQHERLPQSGAAIHMCVDPAARKAQRALLAALLLPRIGQPGVRPEVDGCEVYAVRHVVAQKIAAL